MKQFNRILTLSPYPISVSNMVLNYSGVFWWGKQGDIKPYLHRDFKPSININSRIKSESERISTLLHEIGHAIHYKRHCKCYTGQSRNKFFREYHAQRFALWFMLRYKLKRALRHEVKMMEQYAYRYSANWQNVIKRLQQEKIWQRCKDYLE